MYSFSVSAVGDSEVAAGLGMIIESIECITLGNEIRNDPVATHAYLSSAQVLDDIAGMCDADGVLVLNGGNAVVKDKHSGLITGFIPYSDEKQEIVASASDNNCSCDAIISC